MLKKLKKVLLIALFVPVVTFSFFLRGEQGPGDDVHLITFGDTYYTPAEKEPYLRLLDEINNLAPDVAIFVGDIKAGRTPCHDSEYLTFKQEMLSLNVPIVFTPGDNDWGDCYKGEPAYRPLERLTFVRKHLLFQETNKELKPQRQEHYPENIIWEEGANIMLTLHQIGGKNKVKGNDHQFRTEFEQRNLANQKWLSKGFRRAGNLQAKNLFIFTHPEARLEKDKKGFRIYKQTLIDGLRQAKDLNVWLVHGDKHELVMDKPLVDPQSGETFQNFNRVMVYGSPHVGAVSILINGKSSLVTIKPMLMQ